MQHQLHRLLQRDFYRRHAQWQHIAQHAWLLQCSQSLPASLLRFYRFEMVIQTPYVHPNIQKYPYLRPLAPANAPNKDQTNEGEQSIDEMNIPYSGSYHCRCSPSSLIECPLTLEPEAYRQIKKNLGPVIRQRLRELLKKALTVESAIEAAHTIDLWKLLNESSTELNTVLENMQKGTQQLTDAFLKIPEIDHVTIWGKTASFSSKGERLLCYSLPCNN
ncbi:hypothetical protein RHSIM_Rhsim05G0210100 [Rhododendron simsii]|uniref:Uncharacterized protein n=1 Tax=Rhododendron simsii TaxID=118357 RepID=A0A834LNP5_RHOSS|nr:hypothetical protein RHSIM_Rhsim05G0210100 [Rhododendron simsii]